MGVVGWRFAQKRNLRGRAAIVAVLEDWQVICSAVVVAGSMIMLGIMLYNDLAAVITAGERLRLHAVASQADRNSAFTILCFCSTL